ncbi:MAG: DNA polymerase/3'-5' exonuclease PolX [Candidatus Marsarchaeota archaeon]|nr:DNA polymerase/3'-5' exonuclease PolX [Candidatus Marsarchaeota archaeon]
MENKRLAELFDEIADMLTIKETASSKFEVRAYRKAALTISSLQEPIEDVYEKGGVAALMELPGVGKGIAGKIEEYLKTGRIRKYAELKKTYPIDFTQLTQLEGMGAKRAVLLYKKLRIKNIDDLKKAISSHKIRDLEGFGEKSEQQFEKSIEILGASRGRLLLGTALPAAEDIVKKIKGSGLAKEVFIAGSTRRMRETVGDIDILALSNKPEELMDFFTKLADVQSVISKGPTKTTVWLGMGLSCDLRVIDPKSIGAALQYFTGSKDHNIRVREIAIRKGYKLNEYGLYDRKGKLIESKSEDVIYKKLGMQWVPPEMRESRGEIALAQEGRLPEIIGYGDLHGDLHTHTKETDGNASLDEMAEAAIAHGLKYIATTNHTKSARIAHGMDDAHFNSFFRKVDELNEKLEGRLTILKGAEIDILKDGSLDLEKKTIQQMDCAIASVHSNFNMGREEMTRRVIKAIESGYIHILGHPTGREIMEREPYEIDLEKVAEAAERSNVILEINSQPSRLDLNDTNIMLVSKYKVMFAIDSDSHSTNDYDFLKYGIGTARRGWLGKERVVNALPLEKAKRVLSK